VSSADGLAGVVLAAGLGERLRPLTSLLPKALCPVGGVPLLDHALERLRPYAGACAVNAHHFSDAVVAHVGNRAHVQVEQPRPLGTAGALGLLRGWLDGRDVLLTNADAYTPHGLAELLSGWDGERCRLLASPVGPGERADFVANGTGVRYVGSCLLPWTAVRGLAAEPSGLYEVLWRDLPSGLDLVVTAARVVDCGRPADYLAANLMASGGGSVIGKGAVVEGSVERCVVWPGAYVGPQERLVEVVRAGSRDRPLTVAAGG
jgi:N-acetyl-alpha-D-muramate 1-phosphate uridylyltransferase